MRPHNTDREAALACGDKHFEGNPCRTCGGTLRYTRNYTCVTCMSQHNKSRKDDTKKPEALVVAPTLAEARATKARFYYGKPCFRHPKSHRYTINGHCVECKKLMDKGVELDGPNCATFEGHACPEGHTTRYVSTRRCVECHRAQCKDMRAAGVETPSYGSSKRREEREMRKRLAMIRAERTARQRACAYGVRV